MDIKEKIIELVEKITSDKVLMAKFEDNAIKVVKDLVGVDLPDDQINKIVDGIKAKIKVDDIGDKLDDLGDKLGGLFAKK